MKHAAKIWIPILLSVVFVLRFASCGGDEDRSASLMDGCVLRWEAPIAYTDYTPLNPEEELDGYELFVNETGVFLPDDLPAAFIVAIDRSGYPVESFDMGLLEYPFVEGRTYYFCMRSVTKSGVPSDFSVVFSYTIPALIVGT